jgi:hypothetical protein
MAQMDVRACSFLSMNLASSSAGRLASSLMKNSYLREDPSGVSSAVQCGAVWCSAVQEKGSRRYAFLMAVRKSGLLRNESFITPSVETCRFENGR